MPIIYNVSIESTEIENRFSITWKNTKNNTLYSFEQTIDITLEEKQWLWQLPRHRQIIGEKLFGFLDGKGHRFQKALEHAHRKGDSLLVNLHTCKAADDWPFEVLAKGGTFLLPKDLHLVRCVSDMIEEKVVLPRNRLLKLLFIACSVMDAQPELDFEKEEDAVFHITESLSIDMDVEDSGSLEGLHSKLRQEEYDVVHLSGHAGIDKNGKPYFIMEDDTGGEHRVFPDQLWSKALIKNPPRLVVLSGCRTGETPDVPDMSLNEAEGSFARQMVEKYKVPAVLGWGRKVDDRQAIHAGKMIFHQLSRGKAILDAVQRARYELIKEFPDSDKPAWPLLRLYSGGIPLSAIVKKEQHKKPKPRRMTYIYLKNSRVKVLEEGFIGRRRQLQKSLKALKTDVNKVGLLIMGTGGLGKSCLAGKICERFSDHTLIIIQGRLNTITMEKALNDAFIASQDDKGKKILAQKIEMTDRLSHLCSTSFKERNYLFLLDDFEQNLEGFERGKPGEPFPEAADLLRVLLHYLFFSGNKSQLIITCRYEFSLQYQENDIIEKRLEKIWLTGFNKTEQQKKLPELKNILTFEDRKIVRQLLTAGHGNPRLMEWIDLLSMQLNIKEAEALAAAVKDKQEAFINEHVIRELLKKGGVSLERFLRWFSIYRIPVLEEGVSLVAKKARVKDWKKLLRKGMALSLAEHDQARQSYQVTPLLREELLKGLKDHLPCHKAVFAYFKKVCEACEFIDPVLTEEWIYHALGCGEEEVASKRGCDLVVHLRKCLAYREARRVGEWILKEKNRELSTSDDTFLLNALASVLHYLGDQKQAIAITKLALSVDRVLCGDDHPKVAIDLSDLGEAWRAIGQLKKATILYRKALAIYQQALGDEHPLVAGILNNLGELHRELDKPKEAIEYYERALAIDRTKLGEKHPDVIRDLNNLGLAYLALAHYQQAIEYLQKAFLREQELYGENHPRTADTLNNLASVSIELGQFDKATDYYQQSLYIARKVYGEVHSSVSERLNNLGTVWDTLGDYHKAIDCYNRALEIDRKVYGETHHIGASVLNNLGLTHKTLGKIETAIEYFNRALDIDLRVYGEKHSCVSRDLNNLGDAWHDMGDLLQAIEYYEKALAIDCSLFGTQHSNVALSFNNLGDAWRDLGEYEKALEYFEKAMATWEKCYQEKHPNLAIVTNNMGLVWMALGDCDKAVDYFEQSMNIYKTCFGSDHPDLAIPMTNLGSLYVQLEQPEEAREYLEKAYKLCNKFYGPGHPKTKNTQEWLSACHKEEV